MMKLACLAVLLVVILADDPTVGPVPVPENRPPQSPLIARLRANSPCAGDKCSPEPPMCDPTINGDCENDLLPPTQISCDSIMHCGPCTMHLHCGWCAHEKKCMAGGVSGPTSRNGNCTEWDYAYCSQDPCSVYQGCAACSADPMCGWCSGSATCVEGSAKGPWLNRCSRDSYSFDTCAMSTGDAPAVTVVGQANIQMDSSTTANRLMSSDE